MLFYPRGLISPLCVAYLCHDNDLEAVQVVVERAGHAAAAALLYVETKAHFDYVAAKGSEIRLDRAGRPVLRVESEGHGIYPVLRGEALPERARSITPEDYQLLPPHSTLWARRSPDASGGELWTSGETGFLAYAGARQGRVGAARRLDGGTEYAGGVRPPWGLRASVVPAATGSWIRPTSRSRAIAPVFAAAASRRVLRLQSIPGRSRAGMLRLDVRAGSGTTSPGLTASGAAGGLLLGLGLVSLRAPRRAFAGSSRSSRRTRGQ